MVSVFSFNSCSENEYVNPPGCLAKGVVFYSKCTLLHCLSGHEYTLLHLSWLKFFRSADASVVNLFWANLPNVFYICFCGHKSFFPPKMIPICWAVFLASDEPTIHCFRGFVPGIKHAVEKMLPLLDGWGVRWTIFFPYTWHGQAAVLQSNKCSCMSGPHNMD